MKSWLGLALLAVAGPAMAAAGDSSLVDLADAGQTQPALALIDHGADVNAASEDGSTALLWAAHRDDRALVERLLKAHADVKAANHYGATPMSEAAAYGDPAVIELLLRAGADPDSANADGQTALMVVAHTSNVKAAELLLRHGAHVDATERLRGQTALHFAAAEGQPDMVQELLRHRADANARSKVEEDLRQVSAEPRIQWRAPGGLTPLLYAARQGCMECVQALIKAKADPNLSDPDGISPLLIATENFHFDVAVYLMKVGADPNHWDWWGRTPLYAAVDLNTLPYGGRSDRPSLDVTTSLKMIELLLDAGVNPNAQLKLFPPFRQIGSDRGADLLLTVGTTPLLRAAKAGDVGAMKLLLAHGAKADLANALGVTPLMAAAGLGSNEIDTRGKYVTEKEAIVAIDLLVKAGADVNVIDNRGQSALYGAAYWGWNDAIKDLVAHGADMRIKDAQSHTAVDMAMGLAQGHGRGGSGKVVHEDSAALLQQLLAGGIRTADQPPVELASQLL
ncbi:MAG TPA: ankyrin repeat domain-containing protein [Steroidobacteraceae bacterium]|jgi:ankyrin repeat protein|nr:ankyrin repeat domain-containing protein [Steroidobacteraceae bacterium]